MNDVDFDPKFQRAVWMLENQIHSPDDLIRFWALLGMTV